MCVFDNERFPFRLKKVTLISTIRILYVDRLTNNFLLMLIVFLYNIRIINMQGSRKTCILNKNTSQ